MQDPWLGWLIDRRSPRGWTRLLASSALLLSLAMAALLAPCPRQPRPRSLAGASLALAYTLHSPVNITYRLGRAALRSA